MDIQEKTQCAIIPVETAIEIYAQFKKKEINARAKFKGSLEISPELKMSVQIFPKSRQESMPSLKKYNKNLEEDNRANFGKVSAEKTFA